MTTFQRAAWSKSAQIPLKYPLKAAAKKNVSRDFKTEGRSPTEVQKIDSLYQNVSWAARFRPRTVLLPVQSAQRAAGYVAVGGAKYPNLPKTSNNVSGWGGHSRHNTHLPPQVAQELKEEQCLRAPTNRGLGSLWPPSCFPVFPAVNIALRRARGRRYAPGTGSEASCRTWPAAHPPTCTPRIWPSRHLPADLFPV